jgi:hypothetical protein
MGETPACFATSYIVTALRRRLGVRFTLLPSAVFDVAILTEKNQNP